MRILYSYYLLDDDNPPARIIRAISRELRARGHEVLLHRSSGPPIPISTTAMGSTGRGLHRRLKNLASFAKATARNLSMLRRDQQAIRQFQPDVILARHDAYCCSMAWAAQHAGIPLVTNVDAPMAYETRLYNARYRWNPPRVVETLEKIALRPSRAFTANSRPTARKVLDEYHLKAPIRIVPNGLDPTQFPQFTPDERSRARRDLGIDAPLVIGFQGTFKSFHGVDRLRDLMLALSHRPDLQWLLIGDGPERQAVQQAVSGRVVARFLGRQPPEQMGPLLALMDVAVVPHHFVPGIFYFSPMKVVECAAAGCAVVASNQGDIPWLLDDGKTGVVLDTPDLNAWAAAIEALCDDPNRRHTLGLAARHYALSHFTWPQIAQRCEEVLHWALSNSTPFPDPYPPPEKNPPSST